MPIYEFACSQCGFYEEKLMKISDPLSKVCPKCNQEAFEKLLSKTNFVLKGQGWYETDFKTPKPATKTTTEPSKEQAPSPEPAKPTNEITSKPAAAPDS